MLPVIDLDANATTAPWPEVIDHVAEVLRTCPGNPGSRHARGRQARRVLEDSREAIAAILHADPEELVFTSGGTEANNLAVLGLAHRTRGRLAMSPGEHPATREAVRTLQLRGWQVDTLPVDDQGRLTPAGIQQLCQGDRALVDLVSVLWAHNETGVIQDVSPLAAVTQPHGVPWHLDAVQAVGRIPVDFRQLGCTTLSFGAHKFHGPRGVGGLLVRRGTRLAPLMFGGFQEQQRRPGTEPVALIAGMALALTLWHNDREQRQQRLRSLTAQLWNRLQATCAPVRLHAPQAPRLPNTLNVAFPGLDGEALLVALDLAGVCCSLGSTCASGSTEPAPILLAMGCPLDIARSSLRLSVSLGNTAEEMDLAADRIAAVVARLRNPSGASR
jgi:cysteine desulfurase